MSLSINQSINLSKKQTNTMIQRESIKQSRTGSHLVANVPSSANFCLQCFILLLHVADLALQGCNLVRVVEDLVAQMARLLHHALHLLNNALLCQKYIINLNEWAAKLLRLSEIARTIYIRDSITVPVSFTYESLDWQVLIQLAQQPHYFGTHRHHIVLREQFDVSSVSRHGQGKTEKTKAVGGQRLF